MTRRDWLLIGAVGTAAAVAGAVLGPIFRHSQSGAADLQQLPLTDLAGRRRQVAEWRGKILIVNFWATWCAPCREEMPMLMSLRQAYSAKGVEIVGIALDSASNVREFSQTLKIDYPLLLGEGGTLELMRKLGNKAGGLPFTVILDRHGAIAERKLGLLKRPELEDSIGRLLPGA